MRCAMCKFVNVNYKNTVQGKQRKENNSGNPSSDKSWTIINTKTNPKTLYEVTIVSFNL